MRGEADSEPGSGFPDHVPDDLLVRYRADARRLVRQRRSRSHALRRRFHAATERASDWDVWMTTLTLFGCGIVALGLVGAIVYAIVLWPKIGTVAVVAMLAMLALSYRTALRMSEHGEVRSETEPA